MLLCQSSVMLQLYSTHFIHAPGRHAKKNFKLCTAELCHYKCDITIGYIHVHVHVCHLHSRLDHLEHCYFCTCGHICQLTPVGGHACDDVLCNVVCVGHAWLWAHSPGWLHVLHVFQFLHLTINLTCDSAACRGIASNWWD